MATITRRRTCAVLASLGSALASAAAAGCAAPAPRPAAPPPAAPPPAVPAILGLPELRGLVPVTHLPPGLVLTEELVPRLEWRTPREDPWGRVASYAATFAPADQATGGGPEITVSLNSYLDASRAARVFAEWEDLVPRTYAVLARGPWRDTPWAPGASVAVYVTARPRSALVGFCAGPILGSVRVALPAAPATVAAAGPGADGYADTSGPAAVALELARRVAVGVRGAGR